MKMKCNFHPNYQVKRKPRAACEKCWRMWINKLDRLDYLAWAKKEIRHEEARLV